MFFAGWQESENVVNRNKEARKSPANKKKKIIKSYYT